MSILGSQKFSDNWKPFKNDENSWLLGYVEKRLVLKDKVNFKIYGVTGWTTNIYICPINDCPVSKEVKAIRPESLVS